MRAEEFKTILPTIPHEPGVYRYYGENNELLYVGKAKDLRKRISSYFTQRVTSYKTRRLVSLIRRIEWTVVDSEQDAFLLENNLIKEFQPRFNISLKDDKTYPYIVIKNEPFPRVFLTRRKLNDGSEYLGPFTSVGKVRELLTFIRSVVQLRTCSLHLSPENIRKKKFKVCLEYHLGNCKGPCEGLQSAEDYARSIDQVRQILRGNLAPVIAEFKEHMQACAAKLEFEQAEIWKKKIQDLQAYQAKSAVVNARIGDVDVFSFLNEPDVAYVNYLRVLKGMVIDSKSLVLEKKSGTEEPEDILITTILHVRETFQSRAPEIIVPFSLPYPDASIRVTVPRGGDKKRLLELSMKNAHFFKEEQEQRKRLLLEHRGDQEELEVLSQLQEDLQLPALPEHIECFDNSNFQGSYPVAACVVFKQGKPSKQEYRHFHVKTVQGIDDFASMREIVYRRYKRLLEEGKSLPQLVIIDGGKGQLNAALESIDALGLRGKMTVIGLAKQEEEIFFPGDRESLRLPYQSESLRLIRRIRDEVHRFGISFHRQLRSKGTLKNELESIPGIGKRTADQLLIKFRSVKRISQLSEEQLRQEVGSSRARLIWNWFHAPTVSGQGS
ncbi:MAG: excinuclease ABC subunit UvrC [Thermoflavifilum sp.]|nr:excinuclease ABC subunit UvrC [Thermoflavifilum sp.]